MKMTKAMRLLAVAAALCLGLLGCSPKAMEAFAAWQPEILLHPGETWEGKIPGDGKSPSYTVTVNTVPGLEARVEEDRLVLTATRAGEGQLTLAASAKGYHDTTLTLPVRVEPLPMELSWELVEEELAEGEEPAVWADQDRIGATVGETFTLAFSAAQVSNAVFDLHLPAELGAAQVDGDLATITVGEEYGEGFLTVTARAKDYDDKELSIPFSVVRGRLPLLNQANNRFFQLHGEFLAESRRQLAVACEAAGSFSHFTHSLYPLLAVLYHCIAINGNSPL